MAASSRINIIELLRRQKRLGINAMLIGLMLFAAAGYSYTKARRFYDSALRAPGKIVELERRDSGANRGDASVYPVFTFDDKSGVSHRIQSSRTRTWSNPWTSYAVGDAVEVLYLAEDPENARLNHFQAVWGWAALFAAGGLVFVLIGAVLWYYAVHYAVTRNTHKSGWTELD